MNQILAVGEDNRKTKNQPTEISKVVRFFSIAIIIFGVFMIGTGSYALYKDGKDEVYVPTKPEIVEENKDDKTILLKVMHDKAIDIVEYNWNEDEPQVIQGNGRKYIEQEITIPGGVNVLNVKAVDIDGQETNYPKEYEAEDVINLEVVGSKMKITADTDKNILYMTYRWDEDEETKIDINSTTVEQEIDIPMGEHTLTVVLVDENNQSIIKEQKVKGVTKPVVEVTLDENIKNYIIKVKDEINLDRVELILNGEEKYRVRTTDKEIEFPFELKEGENKLEVTAYNSEGVASKTVKVKCQK